MRLFIALLLTDEVKDALCRGREQLRIRARSGNFSRRENLHLTLAFLGELPPTALPKLRRAMERAGRDAVPFALTLDGMGKFRRPGADLWWAGVKKEPALADLALSLRRALAEEGFPTEERSFAAHLTVARQVDAPGLKPKDIRLPAAGQSVTGMSLMESTREKGILVYREIFSVPLGKPV